MLRSLGSVGSVGRVVAVVHQKGGTDKTITTANLCHALAAASQRVLLIDTDPQANLTSWARW